AGAQARRPECVLEWARYLGRQGRTGQALECCRQARRQCKPEQVAAATVAVFHTGAPTKADDEEVQRWLAGLIEKEPRAAALVQSLAEIPLARGRFAQAEAASRKVLPLQPNNFVIMNNLAFMLAVRGAGATEALELITRALLVAGPHAVLLDTRAQVY